MPRGMCVESREGTMMSNWGVMRGDLRLSLLRSSEEKGSVAGCSLKQGWGRCRSDRWFKVNVTPVAPNFGSQQQQSCRKRGLLLQSMSLLNFWMFSRWKCFFSGSPGGPMGKESICQCRRCRRRGSILGWGRFPRGGNGNPLQYFCLENPKDRRAWQTTDHRVARVGHDLVTKYHLLLQAYSL